MLDKLYTVALNGMDPVRLSGELSLFLTVGQTITLIGLEADDPRRRFNVQTASYLHAISTIEGQELLAFHWNPQEHPGAIAFPHLHLGSALLGTHPPFLPTTLHKAHIPTGRVSLEPIVRLAITEFGVKPLKLGLEDILQTDEATFARHNTW